MAWNKDKRTINVRLDIWTRLSHKRIDDGHKNFSDLLQSLLEKEEKKVDESERDKDNNQS